MLSTVNVKSGLNTPTIRQLAEVLAGINAFDRTTINAWEDEEFVTAVQATSRKKLISADVGAKRLGARFEPYPLGKRSNNNGAESEGVDKARDGCGRLYRV